MFKLLYMKTSNILFILIMYAKCMHICVECVCVSSWTIFVRDVNRFEWKRDSQKILFFWNISHKIWIFMIVLMMFSWQLPIILTHWPKVTQSLFNLWIKKKMILIVNDHQGNLFSNFGIVWKVSFLILTFHNLLIVVVVTLRQWNADFVEYKWREYV